MNLSQPVSDEVLRQIEAAGWVLLPASHPLLHPKTPSPPPGCPACSQMDGPPTTLPFKISRWELCASHTRETEILGRATTASSGFCRDCPDHEACMSGYPCGVVKAAQASEPEEAKPDTPLGTHQRFAL